MGLREKASAALEAPARLENVAIKLVMLNLAILMGVVILLARSGR